MNYSEHPKEVMDELARDFRAELNKIDFSNYDPASREFMVPTTIGMLWEIICHMGHKAPQGDDIQEEISGAKHYMDKYRETGNLTFKDMARDELHHAQNLVNISGDTKYLAEITRLSMELN